MTPYETERLVRVEETVKHIQEDVKELREKLPMIESKLDELITIKQKGAGVFWLLSTIMGEVGIVGLIMFVFEHLRK